MAAVGGGAAVGAGAAMDGAPAPSSAAQFSGAQLRDPVTTADITVPAIGIAGAGTTAVCIALIDTYVKVACSAVRSAAQALHGPTPNRAVTARLQLVPTEVQQSALQATPTAILPADRNAAAVGGPVVTTHFSEMSS